MESTDDLSKGEALSEPLILERRKTRHAADVTSRLLEARAHT